jgi:hypothetical protein
MWQIIAGSSARPLGLSRAMRWSAVIAVGILVLFWGAPAFAQNGGCPDLKAIGNFVVDNNVSADFVISTTVTANDTADYFLSSIDESPTGGIPGLIEYCIYPSQPPGNPASATPVYSDAHGVWNAVFGTAQGFFSFKRYDGDPSNIPIDGTGNVEVGTATWTFAASPTGAPITQTILLHISDPTVCSDLYGAGIASCFVYPGTLNNGPPIVGLCNGAPACKQVQIDQAITTTPLTVPGGTLLNIHYQYTIVNQPANLFEMIFYPPTTNTSDINTGGGKDYFGCEQTFDTLGSPGQWTHPVSEGKGFVLNPYIKTGTCMQNYFFLADGSEPGESPSIDPIHPAIVLQPGESETFFVDMITGTTGSKKQQQEYTSCGLHLLNSGFTVKWFEAPKNTTPPATTKNLTLYSYSTNINPIYVNVVGLRGCPLN